MRRRRNQVRGTANGPAAQELYIYIENNEDLYRQWFVPIAQNLERKVKKGTYDHTKAIKLWMYLVDDGAKRYAKEYASPSKWNTIFTKPTRLLVAENLAKYVETELELGNSWLG